MKHSILIFQTGSGIGGVRTVSEFLARQFIDRGHSVMLLYAQRRYGDDRDLSEGIDCRFLPDEELLSENNVDYYQQLLAKRSIDIVINQDSLDRSPMLIKQIGKCKAAIISVIHNNPIREYDWLWYDAIHLRGYQLIDHIKRIARIVVYPKTKRRAKMAIINQLTLLTTFKSNVIVLSPAYIDTIHRFVPQLTALAIANPIVGHTRSNEVKKEKIVVFVGRLDNRSKRLQYLISIWKNIARYVPDWKLLIIGEGKDGAMLRSLAYGTDNIEFLGYQKPTQFYERAAIICLTSIFEGLPMALLEGMQHGCVPIAFGSFPAIHDVIDNGINGEIVRPFDKKEYGKRLLRLINDDNYRQSLSTNARKSMELFDANVIIDKWEHLFMTLEPNSNE